MPRGVSRDAKHLREVLDEGVHLVNGDADGSIDVAAGAPVFVGIVVDVTGYGPHTGTIYAMQNPYHGNPDEPLQEASEMLEEWKHEHYDDYYKELVAEQLEELKKEGKRGRDLEDLAHQNADELFRETFDGWSFQLDPGEFGKAIKGTDASKYIETYNSEKESFDPRSEDLHKKLLTAFEHEEDPKKVADRLIKFALDLDDEKELRREAYDWFKDFWAGTKMDWKNYDDFLGQVATETRLREVEF